MAPSDWPRTVVCLALAIVSAGCGGDGNDPNPVGATLSIVSGAGQADTVATVLPQPLVVRVLDTSGRPAPNVGVDWGTQGDCSNGGCEILVAADSGAPPSQSLRTTTDGLGQARVWLQLAARAGEYALPIAVPDLGLTGSAPFTVRPGRAFELRVSPRDVALVVGSVGHFDAAVTDFFGNPLATPVSFIPATAGSVEIGANGDIKALAFGRTSVEILADTFAVTAHVSVVPAGTLALGGSQDVAASLVVSTTGSDGVPIPPIDYFGSPIKVIAPSWSPDGTALVVEAPLQTGRSALYTVPVGGDPVSLVASAGLSAARPRWSRDGQWVYYQAFTSDVTPAFEGEIWRVHPDGTGAERVGAPALGGESDYAPDPSPDGTAVVFTSSRGTSSGDLRIIVRTLASGDELDIGAGTLPRWSPSGEWIAFLRDFTPFGYGAVWLVRPDGTEAHAVTDPGVYYDDGLDWSPDGEWLAGFGGTGISLVQISTGLVLPIAQLNGYHTPAWRP